jgi:predicted phosphodiesterase
MEWSLSSFKGSRSRGHKMRHEYIGILDGPILAFGGPYSNAQATKAMFTKAKKLGITCENVICTGDVVAYCGAPLATVEIVRAFGCAVVAGNCEIQLAAGAMDCGCGFKGGTECDLLSAGWFAYASKHVLTSDCEWMDQCPDIISFDHFGARYAVIHGGFTDVARFIWSTSDDAVFDEEWAAVEAAIGHVDNVIAGHSGIPFERDTANGRWINAGVIGMPPHDQGASTRYAMIEDGAVSIYELEYDVEGAFADMQQAGLIQGYDKSLVSGVWPSEDVLPQELRLSF